MVLRTDDGGRNYLVREGLDERQARALETDLTARGHKQAYIAQAYMPSTRAALLEKLGVVL